MPKSNTLVRSLHDLSLAAWFGGSLMGAIGLQGAAQDVGRGDRGRIRIAAAGWSHYGPVNAAAVAIHLLAGGALTRANLPRLAAQSGVGRVAGAKAALTLLAAGATAASALAGQQQAQAANVGELGRDEQAAAAPPEQGVSEQAWLRLTRWSVPVLTGAVIVLNAQLGEQQRPAEVASGIAQRVLPWRR